MGKRHLARITVVSLALAAALSVTAGAPAATPGSIVYVKNNNVWIAPPSGAFQRQVTTNGGLGAYDSPSQADNGTIVAERGRSIVIMTQTGRVLRTWSPGPPVPEGDYCVWGIISVDVSPDASKIAYEYVWSSSGQYGCTNVHTTTEWTSVTSFSRRGTFISRHNPSWMTNTRFAMGSGSSIDYFTVGGVIREWWTDDEFEELDDPEVTRTGDKIALLWGYGDNTRLLLARTNGGPPAAPSYDCMFPATAGPFEDPTWRPDGAALAWASDDGIYVSAAPNMTTCAGGVPQRKIALDCVPDDSLSLIACDPDWSPAAVQSFPCGGAQATRVGTAGSDTIVGTPGNDVIVGLGGNDSIRGGGGNDKICGGTGSDVLKGEGGNDVLSGDAGTADKCYGGLGTDTLTASCETRVQN